MKKRKYAIVDIETTGGMYLRDKITEIAIIKTDGHEILSEFHSLVNPERSIPKHITGITGIDDHLVKDAPKFYEIAKQVIEELEGCIFVAHNVNFDYNFIKEEFRSLGYPFNKKKLCTVKLTRSAVPGLRSYSLDSLIEYFDVDVVNRHRAYDDTLATYKIFRYIHTDIVSEYHMELMINQGLDASVLPKGMDIDQVHDAPETAGVYYLSNQYNHVLYVGGPVMENEYKSFVGMHNVPIVYGMTIGEYALMINGEGWLNNGIKTDLQVIPVQNYDHNTPYSLPISPSPNLPNDRAILLYPSLCLFEGSVVNEGRGTNKQFQIFGHPAFPKKDFSYTPVSMSSSKYPRQLDQLCGGVDLTGLSESDIRSEAQINLSYLLSSYEIISSSNIPFFLDNNFFEKLAGTYQLRKQIEAGLPEDQIRDSWQSGLREFNIVRNKYLLYP